MSTWSSPPGVDLSQIPALNPPPGVVPNFVDPFSRGPGIITAIGVITAIMLLFVMARMYAKAFYVRSFTADDYACIAGTITSIVFTGLIIRAIQTGLGPHQWNVPVAVLFNDSNVKLLRAIRFLYPPPMVFAKLSILLLFLRLFSPNRKARFAIYFGIAFMVLLHVIYILLTALLCLTSNPSAQCTSRLEVAGTATSAFNVISDFYILLLPIFAISKLQMPTKKKLEISAVFFTGFLACCAGVIGLALRIVYLDSPDFTWDVPQIYICLILEIDIGLMVGCMPVLPVLFRHRDTVRTGPLLRKSQFSPRQVSSKPSGTHCAKEATPTVSHQPGSYVQLNDMRPVEAMV